jgi:hypothetical protein
MTTSVARNTMCAMMPLTQIMQKQSIAQNGQGALVPWSGCENLVIIPEKLIPWLTGECGSQYTPAATRTNTYSQHCCCFQCRRLWLYEPQNKTIEMADSPTTGEKHHAWGGSIHIQSNLILNYACLKVSFHPSVPYMIKVK